MASNIVSSLIKQHQLSPEAVAKIRELMNDSGMSFADAAVHLKLLSAEQISGAPQPTNQASNEDSGLVEAAIRRVSSARQVVVRQGEEVAPGEQLRVAFDAHHPRNEKMRVLRTELLLMNEPSRNANVVALLSPDSGEGRSQLAAELAISFAQLGRRTLLVDADMRHPSQHFLFNSPTDYGLSKAISSNSKPYLHPVKGLPNMFLCTAGAVPPNPLELLSDGRFDKLLSDWRSAYEFVVIDTPPVSQYADAIAIATVAGRVLLLGRTQHTSYKNTREMMRRLATTHAKIMGSVLSTF